MNDLNLNIEEINHIRDLALAELLNENDKIINGSILRKLDNLIISYNFKV